MRERLGSFFSKSVASPKPQRTPTASPIASLQYRFHHNHHHQHHHHHHHHHHPHHQHVEYHQLFNDLHPDNRLCFTSGQRFPVTIASLCGRGQEPVDHPQAGGLCQEEGGAGQEAAGGRGQEEGRGVGEEGEDGEDLKSIWALLPSTKHP